MNYINDGRIEKLLEKKKDPYKHETLSVIDKSLSLKGLNLEETATLLQSDDPAIVQMMLDSARQIKNRIYGNRIVLFAPMYISNTCSNNCTYCSFRHDNKSIERKVLTMDEIRQETEFLLAEGHKRVLLVAGENPADSTIEYLEQAISTIYSTKKGNDNIRRININVAPLSLADFRRLKSAGIGTYQLFQETYHKETYRKMHPSGPKSNYERRLYATDIAMRAGIDDVGIGALFGLHDYRFETLALLEHARHLENVFGVGPHTISVPRIKSAENTPLTGNIPNALSDSEFKKLIAILRMAVPYTGIILSTREPAYLRDEAISLGVSQISAGSKTNPGGYAGRNSTAQFDITDMRSLHEVVAESILRGMIPSFCTACYRSGRTGERFMKIAKPGEIHNFCQPNALITLQEYLLDHADEALRKEGSTVIELELSKMKIGIRAKVKRMIAETIAGKRDQRL